ncbi:hypothetical protein RF11_14121 [Thelohanellus kitauei]|uniref:Uncharacterized protein n=1 Tax=Thelohanellus kitauei TaxID=669202 RepID=A0A0C2JY74_THEKT|nr:hypothetical protein RF11_14121 [Thelohanellus kitauei]
MYTLGNKVYIFGSPSTPLSDLTTYSLVSFDISNFSWQDLTRNIDDDQRYSPPEMSARLLFYHDVALYILWRTEDVTGEMIDSMYRLPLKTNIWSLVELNGPKPVFFNEFIGAVFTKIIFLKS